MKSAENRINQHENLNSPNLKIVPVASGTVFQVVVAARTPYAFPVHEEDIITTVLLPAGIP